MSTEVTPTDPPTPDAGPPSGPPSSDPAAAGLDEATITELIKRQVTDLFKAQPKQPAPAGPAVDVEAKIKEAIAAAMAERDKEDQVFVLQQQFDELKASLKAGAPKRGWGAYLLGPGLLR